MRVSVYCLLVLAPLSSCTKRKNSSGDAKTVPVPAPVKNIPIPSGVVARGPTPDGNEKPAVDNTGSSSSPSLDPQNPLLKSAFTREDYDKIADSQHIDWGVAFPEGKMNLQFFNAGAESFLRMRLSKENTYGSRIETKRKDLGYGTYQFKLRTKLTQGPVAAIYIITVDDDKKLSQKLDHHEIDIELFKSRNFENKDYMVNAYHLNAYSKGAALVKPVPNRPEFGGIDLISKGSDVPYDPDGEYEGNFNDGKWHTYRFEFTKEKISWYFDSTKVHEEVRKPNGSWPIDTGYRVAISLWSGVEGWSGKYDKELNTIDIGEMSYTPVK